MDVTRRAVIGATVGLSMAAAGMPSQRAVAQALVRERREAEQAFTARTPDGFELVGQLYGDPSHPEILLVHGLGQSRLSWELQTESDLKDSFRIATFDLRGHGDSEKPDSIDAYSDGSRWGDDLHTVIEAAGLRRPVLVGWSLGGFAIGHYLARHGSERIAGVNLVNAVTKLAPELLSKTAQDYAGRLASPDLAARVTAIEGFLDECFEKKPSDDARRRMLVFNGMVPRAVQQGIVRMVSDGLDEAFASLERVLVTYGAKDALTLPAMSHRIKAFNPSAQLSIYPESGHTPFYEEPERFNAELAAFAAS